MAFKKLGCHVLGGFGGGGIDVGCVGVLVVLLVVFWWHKYTVQGERICM